MTTNQLNIEPPDNFERTAMVRAWMSALPEAPVPAGFDEAVLRRVHERSMPVWQKFGLAGLVVVVIALLGVIYLPKTDVVKVARVPVVTQHTLDLYNLPPAPVREMPAPRPVVKANRTEAHGVAGY